ncbi:MAG: L-glutamate gamma-semialdehyde dehydrogenase [Alphaproteobacteria bacterium]|nr:L-glutamate gamma-semialdehyde dehydrogenase [Alphaproteobacteria bacterium]
MTQPAVFDIDARLAAVAALCRADEKQCLEQLIPAARLDAAAAQHRTARAAAWVETIRHMHRPSVTVTDMLGRFGLTSQEGLALMCLAEALLRIPDRATADALIRDKFDATHWDRAMGNGIAGGDASWSLNAAAWGLALTGRVIGLDAPSSPGSALGRLVARLGQPVIREAIRAAMQWMADQFVMGETIDTALHRAEQDMRDGVRFSFDMLGEGARTAEDAARYLADYENAIDAIAAHQVQHGFPRPSGISVKLSALHPRYEMAQRARVMTELVPRLAGLCERAARHDMPLTIDAEEGDRLYLSLHVAAALMEKLRPDAWQGLGFAVQAYDKRAPAVIDFFAALAAAHNRRLHVRLVKGAYWDTEIKRAQERGLDDFYVYTRKVNTDISYMACARRLLGHRAWVNPWFGTHNALTAAHIAELAGDDVGRVEFQRLHGMGDELHGTMRREGLKSCVYAPVGQHDVLLGYLVRRILENGANGSFVHRMFDPSVPVADLTSDPVRDCLSQDDVRHPAVKRPADLFAPQRRNSAGVELADPFVTDPLLADIARFKRESLPKSACDVDASFAKAREAFAAWARMPVDARAACLEELADALETNRAALMALMIQEGGKCIPDALGEVREAADFCRYYAMRARIDFARIDLPGPTGEHNYMRLTGRGVFVCISPWNFPLAIFLGQIAAALVAGNAVIAKPAPQTPEIALFAARLAYECGIPRDAFQVVRGGADIGAALVAHPHVAGVAFTGSCAAARAINRALAAKDGPIVPLIAETGGQNALIVDNSALPEQVVDDVVTSAFRSAGQRCSALRLLCLPEETADKIVAMLKGAMRELVVGDPANLSTDVGPVIDATAKARLLAHVERLRRDAREIMTVPVAVPGHFVAPQAWEIPSVSFLTDEVFGPILHIVRYQTEDQAALIDRINATGFGLTGGIHSRVGDAVTRVEAALHVGNFYVNRSLIGAVVGVQPFGGEGLSGTGPKAGGPHYLPRFASERVTSVNTTAAGGNASLLAAASE